jgi:hypothetical protein
MKNVGRNQILIVFFVLGLETAFSQGTFVNLDFEHPVTPLMPVDFLVPTTNGIPGWSAYAYGSSSDYIIYNTISLGAAAVSLQGPGSLQPVIQGSYTVKLQGSTGGTPSSAGVGQVGQIPVGTKSLVFWGLVGSDWVSFNGQVLPLIITASMPSYNIYGADVSTFAGQSGNLLFTAVPGTSGLVDNIQFSTSPIPEPSTFALFAFGSVFLYIRRRRFSALK